MITTFDIIEKIKEAIKHFHPKDVVVSGRTAKKIYKELGLAVLPENHVGFIGYISSVPIIMKYHPFFDRKDNSNWAVRF